MVVNVPFGILAQKRYLYLDFLACSSEAGAGSLLI